MLSDSGMSAPYPGGGGPSDGDGDGVDSLLLAPPSLQPQAGPANALAAILETRKCKAGQVRACASAHVCVYVSACGFLLLDQRIKHFLLVFCFCVVLCICFLMMPPLALSSLPICPYLFLSLSVYVCVCVCVCVSLPPSLPLVHRFSAV